MKPDGQFKKLHHTLLYPLMDTLKLTARKRACRCFTKRTAGRSPLGTPRQETKKKNAAQVMNFTLYLIFFHGTF